MKSTYEQGYLDGYVGSEYNPTGDQDEKIDYEYGYSDGESDKQSEITHNTKESK